MVISNSSSSSMTSSTMSRESAPTSSMKEVLRVTCSLLTPRFSQTISITRSSVFLEFRGSSTIQSSVSDSPWLRSGLVGRADRIPFRGRRTGICTTIYANGARLVAPLCRYLNAHCLALPALEQSSQHSAWSNLIEPVHSGGQQVSHGHFPQYRLDHLLDQPRTDFGAVAVRLCINVGP